VELPSDLAALMNDFLIVSRFRQSAFEGVGNLHFEDVAAQYCIERRSDAGVSWREYLALMLGLDTVLKEHYKEQQPTARPNGSKSTN
jgi:hypothetical protein